METSEKEIFERLTAVEQSLLSLRERVDHIEQLVESVQKMTVEIQHMREDFNKLGKDVDDIRQKPAKRWDSIVAAIIGAFAGGIGTAIISLLLGG